MSEKPPLLSVVVPCFNSAHCIAALMASLAAQQERDFEIIVSDGASSDDTLAVVRAHAAALPALRVLSRPDQGVYDAINLAITQARGEWVLVLGSDDTLHAPDTLAQAAPLLRASPAALVYGDVRMMAPNTNGVPAGGRYAGELTLTQLFSRNVCQQSIFYRRTLFAELGGFELRYRLYADWHFNLRVALRHCLEWVDLVVADYAATGMSATARGDPAFQEDLPGLLRRELLARPRDRALWPLQRLLLRQADALRRRGHMSAAWRQLGAYALLRMARVTALFSAR